MRRYVFKILLSIVLIISVVLPYLVIGEPLILTYDGEEHRYLGDIYTIQVDGQVVDSDVSPIILDNHSLVPVRAIFEKLGARVEWAEAEKKVTVVCDNTTIILYLNRDTAYVNSMPVHLEAQAKAINGRTMIPLRFVAEELGMEVGWYPGEKLITVDKPKKVNKLGKDLTLEYFNNADFDEIHFVLNSYDGYNLIKLENPARLVVDFPVSRAASPDNQQKYVVGIGSIAAARFAHFVDASKNIDSSRVVLDISKTFEYQVVEKKGCLIIRIVNPQAKRLSYIRNGHGAQLLIPGIEIDQSSVDPKKAYNEVYDKATNKYKLTFVKDSQSFNNEIFRLNDDLLFTTRFVVDSQKEVSLEFSSKQPLEYSVNTVPGEKMTVISIAVASDPGRGGERSIQSADVKYERNGDTGIITVSVQDYKNYRLFRLSGPNRIILDIPFADSKSQQLDVKSNGNPVRVITTSRNNEVLRIVAEVQGLPQIWTEEKQGEIKLYIKEPSYFNLAYQNHSDRVGLTLYSAKLTGEGPVLTKNYTQKYDETGKKCILTFKSEFANLGEGIANINDDYLESFEVINNKETDEVSLIFNAKDRFFYEVVTRSAVNNTAITIFKPSENGEKLVVIDPGHGGKESGAVWGDFLEKNLNLDLSLRLQELLKSKNIKTYMIRQEDIYVGLYERAFIANDLKATLFLSIHNNANDTKSRGTETLYYPPAENSTGFTGKRFAKIIQDNLITNLGTINRKTVPRPGLVVLNTTNMHSSLAEIAFMDNADDRALLQDEQFKQKAAQALCNAIIQALQEIDAQ